MKEAQFTKGLTIALPSDVYSKIRTITDARKISMAEWMRIAAEKELNNDEYCKSQDGGKNND